MSTIIFEASVDMIWSSAEWQLETGLGINPNEHWIEN